jgi:predicted DNA-binding transcriptional regulator AlpA
MAGSAFYAKTYQIRAGGKDDRKFDDGQEFQRGDWLSNPIFIRAEFQMNATVRKTTTENDEYIPVSEVARRTSMSAKTIRNFIRNDALPHYRNGRNGKILIRWTDYVAWMERRRIELKQDDCLLSILRDMNGAGGR